MQRYEIFVTDQAGKNEISKDNVGEGTDHSSKRTSACVVILLLCDRTPTELEPNRNKMGLTNLMLEIG